MSLLKFLITLYIGFIVCDKSSTLSYYVEDVDAVLVAKACDSWLKDSIQISRTLDRDKADLVIQTIAEPHMHTSGLLAENIGREINLNKNRIDKLNAIETQNLIAHEFGHFLLKSHNDDKNSIMNPACPLRIRKVTKSDDRYTLYRLAILLRKVTNIFHKD